MITCNCCCLQQVSKQSTTLFPRNKVAACAIRAEDATPQLNMLFFVLILCRCEEKSLWKVRRKLYAGGFRGRQTVIKQCVVRDVLCWSWSSLYCEHFFFHTGSELPAEEQERCTYSLGRFSRCVCMTRTP